MKVKLLDTDSSQKNIGNSKFNPKPNSVISLDTETTGVDVHGPRCILLGGINYSVRDQIFMVSMADEDGETWCCSWPVDPYTRRATPDRNDVRYILKTLRTEGINVVFHNSKFDCRMLSLLGPEFWPALMKIHARGGLHDTLFMARVCFTLELTYGLKPLSKKYLGIDDADEDELQKAVVSARRKVQTHNTVQLKKFSVENRPKLMLRDSESKADYWLPKYFDKNNTLCEKYCRIDAYRTIGLYLMYKDIMDKDQFLTETYRHEMQDIWPIVNDMEGRGIRVFPEILESEDKICQSDMAEQMAAMQKIIKEKDLKPFTEEQCKPRLLKSGKPSLSWKEPVFNPSSPQQLMRVLYLPEDKGGLGLETDRRQRKTGKVTTDKDTLRELMYSPFVQALVQYRSASLTKSLFFDAVKEMWKYEEETDNYTIHCNFNQCGTKAGRFSCNSPNVQQMTAGGKKSIGGAKYSSQKIFGPRPGYIWIGADFSQQEARLFALLANVPVMIEAMNSGQDVFKAMANKAWGGKNNRNSVKAVSQALELYREPSSELVKQARKKYGFNGFNHDQVTNRWLSDFNYDIVMAEAKILPNNEPKEPVKELSRQRCKHITYAKIFGGGPGSFAHLLYCSLAEAKEFNTDYDAQIPELRQYIKRMELEARSKGYIINLYGRKLRVDRDYAYRAVSYMIQGTAASMMKDSMHRVNEYHNRIGIDAHIIMTIHDEIKIEVRKSQATKGYMRAIKRIMEDTQGRVKIHIPVELAVCNKYWSVEEQKIKL